MAKSQTVGIRFPAEEERIVLCHLVHDGSEPNPNLLFVGHRYSFPKQLTGT
jgi:hypothetical protein